MERNTVGSRKNPGDVEAALRGLFLRGLDGDAKAYRDFLQQLSAHLRAFLGKRLFGWPDEVEDLVQECLLAMLSYTTQLTRIWTGFFAVMVLASVIIYLTRPFSEWSLFANVLSPVMVTLLFVGEHLVRYRLHPEFERTRLVDAVRAFYGTSSVDSSPGGQ